MQVRKTRDQITQSSRNTIMRNKLKAYFLSSQKHPIMLFYHIEPVGCRVHCYEAPWQLLKGTTRPSQYRGQVMAMD